MTFDKFAAATARFAGSPAMFGICIGLSLAGIASFISDNANLVNGSNLAISIVALLLLPILLATQNRDSKALHAKMDELVKATDDARNDVIGIEQHSEAEIEAVRV